MEYKIIKNINLSSKPQSTLKTVHNVMGSLMNRPHKLQIVQYPEDNGFYLLYLDKDNRVLTDPYHINLQQAFARAKWEFNINKNEWQ